MQLGSIQSRPILVQSGSKGSSQAVDALEPENPNDKPPIDESTSGEMLALGIHLSPAALGAAGFTRGLGRSLSGAWHNLRNLMGKVFHLPLLNNVSDHSQENITRVLVDTARVVGFAAAGFTGLAGIAKMTDSKASKARRLEGAADLMTAGAIAGTVGGLAMAPVILIPVAAAIGILRGAVQFYSGHRGGDVRLSSQGIIDSSRSTSTLLKHSGMQSAAAATLGGLLGTAAACFQMVRGFVDISRGVKSDNRGKEINGLTDVAMATGLLLTAAGVAAPVGIGIAVAAGIAKVSYAVIKPAHKKMDEWMTKHDPALTKVVLKIEKAAAPVVKWLHDRVDDVADWIHQGPDQPPGGLTDQYLAA